MEGKVIVDQQKVPLVPKNNMPELRFPEFKRNWETKKLEELTSWSSGGTPSKERSDYWNGDIPWISASSMHLDRVSSSALMISKEALKKGSRLAEEGTILILVRGSMLYNRIPICIAMKDVAFNQDVKAIKSQPNVSSIYLYYWLKSTEHKLLSMVVGTGIGAGKLETSELKGLKYRYPVWKEQQKIATFLSAVDDKLNKLRRKLMLLDTYKRGLMQKLFSQEIRFKQDDGTDFLGWEFKLLSSFVEVNPSANLQVPEYFKYIDLQCVSKGVLTNVKSIAKNSAPSRAQRILNKGDILFQTVRPYQQNNLAFNLEGNYVASTGYAQLRAKVESGFVYYLIHTNKFLAEVMNRCTGTSYPAINSNDLKMIQIFVPTNFKEQQKIANCLSSFDRKIEATNKQITQLNTFKQGLLQKMFI